YLEIVGRPAAVGRDPSLIVGDTVIYDDSTKIIVALGDTVVLRDPTQQSADVVAHGRVAYNTVERRARVTCARTALESGNTYYVQGRDAVFVSDTLRKQSIFYLHAGDITSCDETVPHYHFHAKEIK